MALQRTIVQALCWRTKLRFRVVDTRSPSPPACMDYLNKIVIKPVYIKQYNVSAWTGWVQGQANLRYCDATATLPCWPCCRVVPGQPLCRWFRGWWWCISWRWPGWLWLWSGWCPPQLWAQWSRRTNVWVDVRNAGGAGRGALSLGTSGPFPPRSCSRTCWCTRSVQSSA